MKFVIFNIGGALATYLEYGQKRIVYDIGSGNSFSPTLDFLVPLFKRNNYKKENEKFSLDQLFISHPQNDHISDIKNLDKHFYPKLFTMPNDNEGMPEEEKIDWDLIPNPSNEYVDYIKEKILPGRKPPLRCSDTSNLFLYYIKARECEDISRKNYANNLSLVLIIRIGGCSILIAGDMMKDGMEYIINTDSGLRNKLKDGIDFLVAPHHGLKSSFSEELFDSMRDRKTQCLNIISEKRTEYDSNRQVDSRYSSKDYCLGKNNLSTKESPVYQRKTTHGHILIQLNRGKPEVIIEKDIKKILDIF